MKKNIKLAIILAVAITPFAVYLSDPKVVFAVSIRGISALPAVIGMIIAAFGYGTVFLERKEANYNSRDFFLMVAVGFGVESFLMTAAGFAGLANLITGLAIIAAGLIPAVNFAKRNFTALRISRSRETDVLYAAVLCVCAVAVLLTLPTGLKPAVFYDGLVYHLALPKYYILEGKITHAPYNFFSFFPQSIEMLYLTALAAGGEIAPKALNWFFAAVCFWGIHSVASEIGGRRAGLWAVLAAMGISWSLICAQILYIEPAVSIFALASFLAALRLKEKSDIKTCVAAAIAIGMVAGSKYNAAPFIAPVGLYVLILLAKSRSWKKIAVYTLVAAAVAAPWYIRNIVVASNPVAPFYFGSRFWTAEQVSRYAAMHSKYALGHSPIYIKILAPLAGFVFPHLFPQNIGLGIAPLFAAIFIPFYKKRRDCLFPLGIFMWGALIWTFTSQQPRLLYVAEVFLVVAGAVALAEVEKNRVVKWVALTVLAISSMISLTEGIGSVNVVFKPWNGILLRESFDDYVSRRVPTYKAMRKVSELPRDAGLTLVAGETRTYYLNRPFIPITAWDINPLVTAAAVCEDTGCMRKKLKDMGVGIIIRGVLEEKRLAEKFGYFNPLDEEKKRLYYKFLEESFVVGKSDKYEVYGL